MQLYIRNLIALFMVLIAAIAMPAALKAQQFIFVTGTLLDQETGAPFDIITWTPRVYYFDTEAEAKDIFEQLKAGKNPTIMHTILINEEGYYEIEDGVSELGALIFHMDGSDPLYQKINGRKKIDVKMTGGKTIKNVTTTLVRPGKPVEIVPIVFDKWLRMSDSIPIPPEMDRSNYRLIFQPYLMEYKDEDHSDTIEWCRPLVADGKEYHATQQRRMGFKMRNDKLYDYLSNERIKNGVKVLWTDSVEMPNPKDGKYRVYGITNMEDYNGTVYNDSYIVVRGLRRPLKHLDVTSCIQDLDPNAKNPNTGKYLYQRNPRREQHSSDNKLDLTFLYNSAQLDPENPRNETELKTLITNLVQVFSTKGASVREVKFVGISSPEGSYQGNLALSRSRIATVKNAVLNRLSALGRVNFVAPEEAGVAAWDSVVPLLQQNGFFDVAQKVQDICSSVSNHDARSARISALPEYETVIKNVFPMLRKVTCLCRFEIFRKPTDAEILDNYNNNRAYHDGLEDVPLYEYSRLFILLKDSVPYYEMEGLYKRALASSIKLRQPWHLPANLLASSYLRRDTVDLNVLRPFIDFKGKINQWFDLKNMEQIWANQMLMYMKAYEGDTARVMADILADQIGESEYMLPIAFCKQMNFAADSKIFTSLASSCPQNNVIMNLAMKDESYDYTAKDVWEELDKSKAVTWYLRAVIESRLDPYCDSDDGPDAMVKCWELDESFREDCKFDADISSTIIQYAEGIWKSNQRQKANEAADTDDGLEDY